MYQKRKWMKEEILLHSFDPKAVFRCSWWPVVLKFVELVSGRRWRWTLLRAPLSFSELAYSHNICIRGWQQRTSPYDPHGPLPLKTHHTSIKQRPLPPLNWKSKNHEMAIVSVVLALASIFLAESNRRWDWNGTWLGIFRRCALSKWLFLFEWSKSYRHHGIRSTRRTREPARLSLFDQPRNSACWVLCPLVSSLSSK